MVNKGNYRPLDAFAGLVMQLEISGNANPSRDPRGRHPSKVLMDRPGNQV
jgi:hypothetical protein